MINHIQKQEKWAYAYAAIENNPEGCDYETIYNQVRQYYTERDFPESGIKGMINNCIIYDIITENDGWYDIIDRHIPIDERWRKFIDDYKYQSDLRHAKHMQGYELNQYYKK
jgi:hypothetical protein